MRIYLDNCCFNRPFDDQSQIRIRLESEAKLFIQQAVLNEKIELAWSYMLDYENSVNPFDERKMAIERWRKKASVFIRPSPEIVARAEGFATAGVRAKDALHIACALEASCDWFLTTDDILIRQLKPLVACASIAVANPLQFITSQEVAI